MKNFLAGIVVAFSTATLAIADNTIKIGFMATLEGPYTVLGEDSQRGFEIALNEFNNEELIINSFLKILLIFFFALVLIF